MGGRVASNSQPICLLWSWNIGSEHLWGRNMLKHVLDIFFLQKVFLHALLIDGWTTYLLKPAFYTKCQFVLLENPHIHMISLDP